MTIEEIDDTFNMLPSSNINDSLVEFSQATQTSTLIIPSEQLKQDIGVLNYLVAEVESSDIIYNVYVPNNRMFLSSVGKTTTMTLYKHTKTDNYVPSFLSINGRKVFGNETGQIGMLFRDLIPLIDTNSKIVIEGTIQTVSEDTVIETNELNPIAAAEILNIITNNYSESTAFESGFYYKSTTSDGNYDNLVFYAEKNVNGEPIILVAVYPLSHVDDIVQAVRLVNTYTFIVIFLVLIGASFVYSNSFSKPLQKINLATKSLAKLDFSKNTLTLERNDEFGELSENINLLSINLQNTLERLTMQNNQLSASLERENENEYSRKTFIRGLSHEIKTPLAVIQASSEAIETNVFKTAAEKLSALKTIQSEVIRTNSILNSMMQVYKVDTPNYEGTWEKIDMKDVFNDLMSSLDIIIRSKNLLINSRIESTYIDGDYEKLSLILSNLIINAIKYSSPNTEVDICLSKSSSSCVFEITNTTDPITDKDLNHLFDPFYKIDKSGSRALSSTGLGLYIVQQTLKQYDSQCHVFYKDNKISFKFQIKSSY